MIVLVGLLAVAALVPLAAALAQRPQRGVLLLAALVPFDGLLLLVDHPAFVEGWKEGLVVLTLAVTFIAPPHARGVDGRQLPDWLLPAAGLLAISVVSALFVGGVQAAQGLKINFFYGLLFWAIWRCPLTFRDRDHLVTVLMGVGAITAVVGIAQQIVGPAALNALGYEYNTAIRTTGSLLRSFSTFNQPFPFGLFLMLVLLVGLPVALADPLRRRNLAFLVGSPVLLAGMLSSTVRSAVLGLVVGLVFLAVHRYRGLLHAAVPVVIGLLFVPSAVYTAFLSSSSLGDRTSGWNEMVEQVTSAPFGVGIGATGAAAEKTAEVGGSTAGALFAPEWDSGYQPDNYYVKELLELGSVGLWLFVLFVVASFAAARQCSLLTRGADSALAAGIAASIAAAAAASLVATYLEIFPMDVYFWLLLAVVASLQPARRPDFAVLPRHPAGATA